MSASRGCMKTLPVFRHLFDETLLSCPQYHKRRHCSAVLNDEYALPDQTVCRARRVTGRAGGNSPMVIGNFQRPRRWGEARDMTVVGTFETCRRTPKMSACRGRPEVIGPPSKRRF